MRRLAARLRRGGDDGFTLVEMMVVVGLSMMVMAVVGTTMVLGLRTTAATQDRLENADASRVATTSMTKELRTAIDPDSVAGLQCPSCASTAVFVATASAISFYANEGVDLTAGGAPQRVTYEVQQLGTGTQAQLVETVQAPTVSGTTFAYCTPGPGCAVRSRVLARGLAWPPQQLFRYYDASVSEMSALPLTGAALGRVDSIDLTLRVDVRDDPKVPATTTTVRVALPNADVSTSS